MRTMRGLFVRCVLTWGLVPTRQFAHQPPLLTVGLQCSAVRAGGAEGVSANARNIGELHGAPGRRGCVLSGEPFCVGVGQYSEYLCANTDYTHTLYRASYGTERSPHYRFADQVLNCLSC